MLIPFRIMAQDPHHAQSDHQPSTHATQPHRSPRRLHFGRAALIGLCAGLLAVAFRRALALAEDGRGSLLAVLHNHPTWGWLVLPVVAASAGGIVGWATIRFAPEAAGSGIPHLKGVMLHLRRLNWAWLLPVKFVGGVLGVGAGLSLGREGPTVQMGAAIAKALAVPLRAPTSDLPQLLSAGAGAGLAAAFNAPLAGLLFVIEELHRELSSRTAAGALVAAVTATVAAQWLAGDTPSFEVHGLHALPFSALPLSLLVGVLGGALGVGFNRALLVSQSLALSQKTLPRWLLPAIAGAAVGIAAWWFPDAVGGGHGVAERVLGGTMNTTLAALLVLLVIKFVLTAVCYASGAPGGIFAPMLLLGALLGAAFGKSVAAASSSLGGHEQVLAVLGMTAVFVGSVRAPLTGIVLISEMTDGYELLFPVCIAALGAYLTAEAFRDSPIYDALLEADLHRSGTGPARVEPRSMYIGVQSGSPLAGRRIAECATAGLPSGSLIVAVERGGSQVLPAATTTILPGDHITVLTPGDNPESALEVVRLCTGM